MANETQELIAGLRDLNQVLQSVARVSSGTTLSVGRFSAAIAAGTTAITFFTRELNRAIGTARRFTDFRLGAGAGTEAASQASALLSALGVAGGRHGALAAGIRDAISAGGQARSAASQLGVGNVLPRGLGGPSDVDVLLQAAEGIRRITSEQEAYNVAIRLGAPELLRFRLLGDQQIRQIRRMSEEMQRVFGPEAQARLARFEAARELFFLRVQLELFKVFDRFLSKFVDTSDLQGALKGLQDSMNANTNAVQSNTVAISQNRQVFGGGDRARGAFPAGLRGELLRRQMEGERIKLGAFAL